MSINSNFPTDKEVEDRQLLPLSYNFYADEPDKCKAFMIDFVGILIKSIKDNGADSIKLSQFQEMREAFKHDKA